MRICEQHQQVVPLLSTMAFIGAEYWCPFCGYRDGVLEAGRKIYETAHLTDQADKWRSLSRPYLHALSVRHCVSTMHKGVRMKPDELPDDVKAEHKRVIAEWKYGQSV